MSAQPAPLPPPPAAPPPAETGEGLAAYLAAFARLAGDGRAAQAQDEQGRLTAPYPGMRSFSDSESGVFFGRRAPVEDLIRLLGQRQIIIVLGGSGSGKSSVVRAGLIPDLRLARAIPGRNGRWYVASFMPGRRPARELLDGLWRDLLASAPPATADKAVRVAGGAVPRDAARAEGPGADALREAFHAALTRDGRLDVAGVRRFASEALGEIDFEMNGRLRGGAPSLILLMDQFEEIFKPDVDPAERDDVLALLRDVFEAARRGEAQGFYIAVTLRSEELHRCAEHPALPTVVNSSFYLLELIGEEALRDAIVKPARIVFEDWTIPPPDAAPDAPVAPELVTTLLARSRDIRDGLDHRPDQLPLLQHALRLTWENAARRWSALPAGAPVRVELADLPPGGPATPAQPAYLKECLNEAAGAAFERAVAAYAAIARVPKAEDEARWVLRIVLVSMAQRDDRGNWVRRLLKGAEAARIAADAPGSKGQRRDRREALEAALDELVRHGYVAIRHAGQPFGEREFEVCHEALIRSWRLYGEWLKEAEAVTRALCQMVEAASGLDPSLLKPYPRTPAGLWAWLRARKELAARDVAPVATREQLGKVFCPAPLFGHGWLRDRVARELAARAAAGGG
ncbi:hypothetical protein NK718_20045 [Alsobacter sp. SYSU M60028]|uniref:Novel STAND NTPase 1 domain-containing protein n=1 Tax=Alsobacter ponti TaxID=2962936 RepID=A0ABT1LHA6_9HYPH|nr:hypothetical protein [Alsobacter ponti]MCP8940824.1 hypothetical protein [Alsobacter ponti]